MLLKLLLLLLLILLFLLLFCCCSLSKAGRKAGGREGSRSPGTHDTGRIELLRWFVLYRRDAEDGVWHEGLEEYDKVDPLPLVRLVMLFVLCVTIEACVS